MMTEPTTGKEGSLRAAMADVATKVEAVLSAVLPEGGGEAESRLYEAMRYATLGGGKRFRPFLVVASAALFEVPEAVALRVGAAVEMIHSYSLVHDDLPCMDDDALRRGKPSCHVAFGEATAILAGDALMPLAFELLCDPETHPDPLVRGELVASLARAAGARGMVGGQAMDLAAEHKDIDAGEITRLERLKTGALISFACEAGPILGRAGEAQRSALAAYAHDLGLAYQIVDDLLDVVGNARETGKGVGKDKSRGKATFVSILGTDRARDQAAMLADQAVAHLQPFGTAADTLRRVARYVVERPS